jgi:hypothetical protein
MYWLERMEAGVAMLQMGERVGGLRTLSSTGTDKRLEGDEPTSIIAPDATMGEDGILECF